jgi:hypothetical protein
MWTVSIVTFILKPLSHGYKTERTHMLNNFNTIKDHYVLHLPVWGYNVEIS